jgi:NTP pyrophosphatase (non-canonical NTP hydrolase)
LTGKSHIKCGIKYEELQELQVEVEAGNQDNIEAEFGDVLYD